MKLDHIGIAVRSLEQALKFYRDTLGLRVAAFETLPGEKVRVAILPLGETRLELIEATTADSPIARFLEKRGEGIHHIAIEVEQLPEHLRQLGAAGVQLIPPKAAAGAGEHKYAFLHPTSCCGVLLELVEAQERAERESP